jgi:hypothetical protein
MPIAKALQSRFTLSLTLAVAAFASARTVAAQEGKLSAAPPVSYANHYELYTGFNFQNTQAGQAIPYRANLGGVEVLGTDWITKKIGLGVEFRGEAGSTPTNPGPIVQNNLPSRPNIYELMFFGGVQYRGPKNQHAALNFHAFGGAAHGVFDAQTAGSAVNLGLYTNRTSPQFALGASLDFNRSKKLAIRFAPDLILEHWGTETREFFYISGGVIYRFGKK